MWGRFQTWVPLAMLVALVGCEQTSAPARRDILGTWEMRGVPGTTASMTLAEVARAVEGAGAWTDASGPYAFLALGALARDQVTLYFDFSAREDVGFQGRFITADSIGGRLVGGGFQSVSASLVRVN